MKRTVIVSDFSDAVIEDESDLYVVTFTPRDRRRAVIVAEAHCNDKIIKEAEAIGRKVNRRGRKPKHAE